MLDIIITIKKCYEGGNDMTEPVLSSTAAASAEAPKKAYIIVLGNEKGGSGKTTTCMHLIVSLLRLGFTVGSIDIDSRQRSLSRYLENRRQTMLKEGVSLPQPQHIVIQRSPFNIVQEAEEDERERFTKALSRVVAANDFVVVDSPGSDTFLARVAHAYADTVITPINDSFVDLDVLATVDGQTMKIIKPSIYSEMVWEQKLQRAKRDGGSIEWIVMRNRLSNIDAKNKRFMTQVTTDLSRRIGFRVAPGFSERVIFREMFLQGLTVLDIMEAGGATSLSLSHVAARQEVRDLLKTLQIPRIDDRITKARIADGEILEEKPAAVAPVTAAAPAMPATPTVEVATAPAPVFTAAAPEKRTKALAFAKATISMPKSRIVVSAAEKERIKATLAPKPPETKHETKQEEKLVEMAS
jgi:chromosome partitioning protein